MGHALKKADPTLANESSYRNSTKKNLKRDPGWETEDFETEKRLILSTTGQIEISLRKIRTVKVDISQKWTKKPYKV